MDAGVGVPDVSLRRPSWLLTRLLPGVAAVLALGCLVLAILPYVLAPLRPPLIPGENEPFGEALAADRLAPFRQGARAPEMLSLSFALYACLFLANTWMLPRLTRLAPGPRPTSDVTAFLVFLVAFVGAMPLVGLGWRVVLVEIGRAHV